jgi:TolB-like protein/DNA-binding winged helix-turn-helix (wHTH) protein/tetratricopeptide (TPR) repeat protein
VNEHTREFWRIGDWQVRPDVGEINRDGQSQKLDPREMRLLLFLAERPGQVVGIPELLQGVWGKAVVTPHSVYEAIAALRHSLGDRSDEPTYITTLPRRGYRLIASVERCPSVDPGGIVETAVAGVEMTATRRRGRLGILLATVAIALGLIVTGVLLTRPVVLSPVDKSIAVLPFLDLSEKKDQEYFADGLAEELLEVLFSVPGLRVIGRTSSFQFKNKNEDMRGIGAKLGAGYIVEGSVRRDGSRVRVAVQLIRASDGAHQWSGTYDRNVEDTLQLESELAASLGRALQISVEGGVAPNPITTKSAEANDHYLHGLHALDRYTRAGTEEAVNQFQAAIALDPQFAAAYVSLGMAHYVQAAFGFSPPDTGFRLVRQDVLSALKLNSRSAVAHALLARVATLHTWDWAEAQRQSEAALALGPQSSFALYAAADLASVLGDFKRSEQLFRAALVADPLDPETHFMLALGLTLPERLDEAEAETRRCLAIAPDYAFAHFQLAAILIEKGQDGAVAECLRETPEGGQKLCLAEAYYASGHLKESDTYLEEAIRTHAADQAFLIATVFGYRGQTDLAFEWLERAYAQRDPLLESLKASTEFAKLKDDRRYAALLEKMNLPQ